MESYHFSIHAYIALSTRTEQLSIGRRRSPAYISSGLVSPLKKYKIGLIYCLLNRAWKICTDEEEREREINKIRAILAKNEYPEQVVEDEIKKFIGNRQRENEQPPQADQQLAPTASCNSQKAEKVHGPPLRLSKGRRIHEEA